MSSGPTDGRTDGPRTAVPRAGRRPPGACRSVGPSVRRSVCCLGLSLALASCAGPAPDAPSAHVYIPRGASLAAVADSLESHGVIDDTWAFRLFARVLGLARRIRPGLYAFPVGEHWRTIVAALKSGRTDDAMFTVPEGLTVRQIAELASEKLRLARDSVRSALRDSFIAAARDRSLLAEFGVNPPPGLREPAEGYLLPETYRVAYDDTPRDLVRHMLRQFQLAWDSTADRRAAALGFSRHQVMTLASIVEAEARLPGERRRIAGVYSNRLRKHMLLQADPTVIYALGWHDEKHVYRLLYRDLKIRSPYNTYLRPGLPPGPIDNPGRGAILAALDPEPTTALYFVARPDGRHMFSNTAKEHTDSVAVARVLRAAFEAHKDSVAAAERDSIARLARRAP